MSSQIPILAYSAVLESARELYKKEEDVYVLESYIDIELLKKSASLAKKYGEEFLTDFANFLIEVDGGINNETTPEVVNAGADVLVAGNAIFAAGDVGKSCRNLKKIAQDVRAKRG